MNSGSCKCFIYDYILGHANTLVMFDQYQHFIFMSAISVFIEHVEYFQTSLIGTGLLDEETQTVVAEEHLENSNYII